MKRFALMIAGLVLALSATAAQVPLKITYTLPTVACTVVNGVPVVPCDNVALTGANALTALDVYIGTAPILDTSTAVPTATLTGTATSYTSTFTAGDGDTIYVRMKARTASSASSFSNQASKTVAVKVVPNAPVIISVELLPAA